MCPTPLPGFGAQQDAEGIAGIRAQEPDPFRGGQQLFRSPQQPHRAGAVAGAQYGDLHARSRRAIDKIKRHGAE